MRFSPVIIAGLMLLVGAVAAASQPVDRTVPQQGTACPPDVKNNAPTLGDNNPNLSDRLAESKGVICPPAGVDPQMQVAPPGGGQLKVIPPPGSPGGDPNVQPK